MRGQLTDHPLVELIREIDSKNLSGTLRLEHESVKTVVYFDEGALEFAASNVRTLRLREYVVKRNVATEKEFDTVAKNLPDLEVAKELVRQRRMTQDQLEVLLSAMVADVLRVALLWTEGSWEFDPRARLASPVNIELDIESLMREAARRMPLKFVSERFRNPTEKLSRSATVSLSAKFLPAESFLLSRLDSPTPLDELVAVSGLRDLDAYRVIYGLALSGAAEREYWQNAFRADVARPKTQRAAGAKPVESKSSWSALSSESELELFLERLDRAENHYEILGISPDYGSDQIKDAYYTLARRYHPDRFHLRSGTALHTRLSSSFARITHAYETLVNDESRATYDATLKRAERFAGSSAPEKKPKATSADDDDHISTDSGSAEYNFKEGFGALQQGRVNAAINYLAAAARAVPDDPRYRAYYGKALASTDRTRRLAENEIQAAVRLEPNDIVYRVMLAELFIDLNFHRRAESELNRALELDSQNARAHTLMRKLKRTRQTG